MSRILIHSNAPWVPSGYGKQCAHLVRSLRSLGHEVVVSAFSGLGGAPIEWEGTTVLPAGMYEFGVDVLIPHIGMVQPDLTITLMDVWKLGPLADQLKAHNVAAWLPTDCTPLSKLDESFLKVSEVKPIAMSIFGQQQLEGAGLPAPYVPHVIDRELFKPLGPEQREAYREGMGLDGKFVIGLCAANNDAVRKGFAEQFDAFRRFHKKHPDSMLLVHSIAKSTRGLDLDKLAHEIGIEPGTLRFTETYPQISGVFDDTLMRDWYGVLDVLSMCSYAEAFGVPAIEAQSCGTPVVSTIGSAMSELRRHGWGVAAEPFWNHVHGAWWMRPKVDSIVRAYEKALGHAHSRREASRVSTEPYDCHTTAETHWKGVLEDLCA